MNKKLATWQTSRVSRWGTRQSKEFLSWSRQQKQPFFSDSRTNVSKLGNFVVSHVCLPVIFRFYGAVKAVRGWSWKSFETVDCFPHFHVALKTLAHRNLDGISIYKRNYLYSLLERAKYTAGNFYIPRERSQRQRLLFKWNQLTSLRSLSSAQRLPKLLPLSALSSIPTSSNSHSRFHCHFLWTSRSFIQPIGSHWGFFIRRLGWLFAARSSKRESLPDLGAIKFFAQSSAAAWQKHLKIDNHHSTLNISVHMGPFAGEYPGVIMTIVLRRKINYHLLQVFWDLIW